MTSLLDRAGRSSAAGEGPRRVVVIGGGIAGLATAALLAAQGHSVDLLEKNDELGGRVGSVERDGFRFDTGASWYLMPEVFEHFFSLLGTTADAELDLVTLDPSYRVFFEGHPDPVDVRPDRAHNRALFESLEPGAGERFDAYLRSAEDTYDVALRRFLYSNFDSTSSFLRTDVIRRTPALSRLLTRSLGSHVAAHFTDNRLRQVLGYPAVFLGSSPSRAPSLYHLMSRLDLGDRVLYPQGGFTRLIEVIAALAERHGARLHTGAAVTRILTGGTGRRPHVTGVEHTTAGGERRTVEADVVVGAADLHHLETALLPPELQTHPETSWKRRSPGPGRRARDARRRGAPAGAGPPLAVLHRGLGPELRRHLRAPHPRPGPRVGLRLQAVGDRPERGAGGLREPLRPRARARRRHHRTGRRRGRGVRPGGARRGRRDRPGRPGGPASPTCATGSWSGTRWGPRTSSSSTTRGAAVRSASSTRCGRARSSAPATCRPRSTGCSTPAPVPSPVWDSRCA